jgi:hypothetical protein
MFRAVQGKFGIIQGTFAAAYSFIHSFIQDASFRNQATSGIFQGPFGIIQALYAVA